MLRAPWFAIGCRGLYREAEEVAMLIDPTQCPSSGPGFDLKKVRVRGLFGLFLASCVIVGGQAWAVDWSDSDDVAPIATILLEAQNQPLEGQIAVGEVIRNRMKRRGQTAPQVCHARKQFSCWLETSWYEPRLRLATTASWDNAARAWELSASSDLTHGSQFYFNPRLAKPSWARKMVKTATIASHEFYREGGVK